jgi:hypothetical protein
VRLRKRGPVGTLTFITRAGCTLCADAQPVVQRLADKAGVVVDVRDVDREAGLATWSDHVPVVLLDGVEHSRWWVDKTALAKALGVRV